MSSVYLSVTIVFFAMKARVPEGFTNRLCPSQCVGRMVYPPVWGSDDRGRFTWWWMVVITWSETFSHNSYRRQGSSIES
jgi:hypothetical protein